MEQVDFLVVGAGISGLGFANAIREQAARAGRSAEVLVVEREHEAGGYCRTVKRDGFVWDYSGHFFHFRHPAIEAWLRERMPAGSVRSVQRKSRVRVRLESGEHEVDFPFQLATHQLPKEDFLRCLADLVRARDASAAHGARPPRSFKDMLERRFGAAMCDAFLVPYNEKLYACDLDKLDVDAMGRFFPQADVDAVLAAVAGGAGGGYNAQFTYPTGGAVEYVRALLRDLPEGSVALGEELQAIDVDQRIARTSRREVRYGALVTSAPLPQTLARAGVAHDAQAFAYNRVLVFNLGFDAKGRDDAHWIYFADRALSFYRVGFYDNIFGADAEPALSARMSLYVEVGLTADEPVDVDARRARVLRDLRTAGIVTTQTLVAEHHVLMSPAYVHITQRSLEETTRKRAELAALGIHSIGRYGAWTYCSIEDNLIEARALARTLME